MTFSSRTVEVACQKCKQGVMEIHYGDKIFGPYQKISHTRSYEEKEKVDCRVIWHEVHGFSDDEMEKNFEFICCNCKRKGPLETFEIMTATTFMNKFA